MGIDQLLLRIDNVRAGALKFTKAIQDERPDEGYRGARHSGLSHSPFSRNFPAAMKLATAEPCCFVAVASSRRYAQDAYGIQQQTAAAASFRPPPAAVPRRALAQIAAGVCSRNGVHEGLHRRIQLY